jgi:hypothetical protein
MGIFSHTKIQFWIRQTHFIEEDLAELEVVVLTGVDYMKPATSPARKFLDDRG